MARIDEMMSTLEKQFEKNPEGFRGAVPDSKVDAALKRKKKQSSKPKNKKYSLSDKFMYYFKRKSDKTLTKRQREYADKRYKSLSKKLEKKERVDKTPSTLLSRVLSDIYSFTNFNKTKSGFKTQYYNSGDNTKKTIYLNFTNNDEWSDIKETRTKDVYSINVPKNKANDHQTLNKILRDFDDKTRQRKIDKRRKSRSNWNVVTDPRYMD